MGVEPTSQAWEAWVIAVIRQPQVKAEIYAKSKIWRSGPALKFNLWHKICGRVNSSLCVRFQDVSLPADFNGLYKVPFTKFLWLTK